ncbi:MAG: cyanophycin synthetase [Bacteroidetes bacterium]|nr:MAG: cyanophycin synthetase [Bacteroidota bacterium]
MRTQENDFDVRKFYFYYGPSHYLAVKALVFNLHIATDGPEVDFYKPYVFEAFPKLKPFNLQTVADLFAHTLLEVLRMDIDLHINELSITEDGDDYVIAIEFLDDYTAEDAAVLVSDWFKSINDGKTEEFNFLKKFELLKRIFDKSVLGGPTLYALVEAGMKNEIPVFFLEEENQYQWGYGVKQLRGRSTTMHTDGIKDTEFTMYKDMVTEFLLMCGFPTPAGRNCFTETEALSEARKLGFPVVVKPVSGHKGIGVTTGIKNESEVKIAFQNIMDISEKEDIYFDGAIVQEHIAGHDHRILTIDGKFAAALKRIPAYVDGNGQDTIEKLIEEENKKEIRLDNARSPLAKIHIDKELLDYLLLQNLQLNSIPADGERIFLRRVANISAGGVSVNVTHEIHPQNIELAESIAGFFKVKCLGIDVLAADISTPWGEGIFGIIEINAGPGVFMHLAPAYGGSIDVPEMILLSHFKKPELARIPIIAGNQITQYMMTEILGELKKIDSDTFVGALAPEGVFFNGKYFFKNTSHDQNVKIILRHPETAFAIFNHSRENIYDYGFFHEGADLIILDHPNWAEESMKNMLLPGGYLIEVSDAQIKLSMNSHTLKTVSYIENEKENILLNMIKPFLRDLINKYSSE